jgi:hypothetical protein
MSRNHSKSANITWLNVDTFIAHDNSFTTLPLDFEELDRLYILDNPKLTTLLYSVSFGCHNLQEIVITGNPLLNLSSTTADRSKCNYIPGTPPLDTKWAWPFSWNFSIMVFDGPFDNAFL